MTELLFLSHRVPYPPDKGKIARGIYSSISLDRMMCILVVWPTIRPTLPSSVNCAKSARVLDVLRCPRHCRRAARLRACDLAALLPLTSSTAAG